MKICKECKEPKFNFQMYKFSYTVATIITRQPTSTRLKYCKKCVQNKIFNLLKSLNN